MTRSAPFRAGDAIRGLPSLMVVAYHVAYFGAVARLPFRDLYGSAFGRVVSHFDLAVYPFFALSGYLVGRGFVNRFLDYGAVPSLSSYGIRRVLRVVPAFWIAFSVLLIWWGTLGDGPWDIASVYLFAQNYHGSHSEFLVGPAWTLDIEAVFYVALPAAFVALVLATGRFDRRGRLDARGRRVVLLGMLGALSAASIAARPLLPQTQGWQVSFAAMVFCFTPGLALAAVERDARAWFAGRAGGRGRGWRFALAALAAAVTVLYFTGSQNGLAPAHFGIEPVIGAAAGGLWVAAALVWEWSDAGVLFPFNSRLLAWVGERSYSLYVIHTGILFELIRWHVAAHHALARFVVLYAATLACSLAIATLMWWLIERPGMALGHRLSARFATRPRVLV